MHTLLHRWLPSALALLGLVGTTMVHAATALPLLECQMRVLRPQANRVELEFLLKNPSPQPVHLLTWGTPFEGAWFAPFVRASVDGAALAYRGAQIKRADPDADEYLRLPAAGQRRIRVDLADGYDWAALPTGTAITLDAHWHWHDAFVASAARPPRARDRHQPAPQACGRLELQR